jgi:predicted AlkP superfamily pyrophosphatase or phosphodiesterase
MKRFSFLLTISFYLFTCAPAQSQSQTPAINNIGGVNRPKLVVGLVIDQMRWDYLYRYADRYGSGGFKRLLKEGFSVENTLIPYLPTYTACGHSSIYTGSVPSINGIIGNDWYDPRTGKNVYCTEDNEVKTVGSSSNAGLMSPKNLLTTTIGDELKLATNFKSKVIGISLKDRGAILPAGHTANSAYWYDAATGNWITSTYYMKELPQWVQDINKLKLPNKYLAQDWKTLYPIETYTQSSRDNVPYEGRFKNETTSSFPHVLKTSVDKNFEILKSTPYGNTFTLEMAKSSITSEKLGQGSNTDFLAVSCSSTDYVGHQYGPNSIEAEDTYLRLDKDIADFLTYLDKTIGKGNYLFFLSADHGAAQVPKFMAENKLPGGIVSNKNIIGSLNAGLEKEFGIKNTVLKIMNNQIIFDRSVVLASKIDVNKIKGSTIELLKKQPGIANAVDLSNLSAANLPAELKTRLANGYNAILSGDVYFLLQPNWFDGADTGTTHGSWYPYDAHIPLVFMGWNVKSGSSNKTHYMTDIASTLAAMLHIQMPSGNVGEPITELMK